MTVRSNTNHYQNDHLAAKSSCGARTDMAVGFQYASSISRLYGGRESPHQSRASVWVWVAPADMFHDQIDDREGRSTDSAESVEAIGRKSMPRRARPFNVLYLSSLRDSAPSAAAPATTAVCGRWLGACVMHVCTIVASRPKANRRQSRVIYDMILHM